jgi:hypothetical protein
MMYREPNHESQEKLLWAVHDLCHDFVHEAGETAVPDSKKLDRLMLCIAQLALALAGGFREGGVRQ